MGDLCTRISNLASILGLEMRRWRNRGISKFCRVSLERAGMVLWGGCTSKSRALPRGGGPDPPSTGTTCLGGGSRPPKSWCHLLGGGASSAQRAYIKPRKAAKAVSRVKLSLRHLTRDMATDIDALLKATMASLGQPEEKAVKWVSALAESLIANKSQLTELLNTEREEKKAGRGGCEAWRTVLLALRPTGIAETAWPVVEAKLIKLLDEKPAGPAAPPQPASSSGTPPLRWRAVDGACWKGRLCDVRLRVRSGTHMRGWVPKLSRAYETGAVIHETRALPPMT